MVRGAGTGGGGGGVAALTVMVLLVSTGVGFAAAVAAALVVVVRRFLAGNSSSELFTATFLRIKVIFTNVPLGMRSGGGGQVLKRVTRYLFIAMFQK